MTDLDALLARARLTAGHGAPVLLPPAEALALVEEVERLRAYVGDLKRHGASLHKAAGAGRDAERAAVVAWLRRVATDARDWSERADVYDAIADDIESGEHRREEDGK